MRVITYVCLLMLLTPPLLADERPLLAGKTAGLTYSITRLAPETVVFVIESPKLEHAEVFSVEDPDRLVVDLPGLGTGRNQKFPLKDPLLHALRVGVHPGKIRMVLDLTAPATFEWHQERKGHLLLKISAASPRKERSEESLEEPQASVSQPVPSPAATVAAPATPAAADLSPETVKVISLNRTTRVTPSPAVTATPPPGEAVLRFQFAADPDSGVPVAKLVLTSRPRFSVVKQASDLWIITIFGTRLAPALTLPFFPPQDFAGLNYLQGKVGESGDSQILVGVSKEHRLLYFTRGNEIWLKVQPAGDIEEPEAPVSAD